MYFSSNLNEWLRNFLCLKDKYDPVLFRAVKVIEPGNSSSEGLVVIMQGGRPLQIERITFNLEEVISGRVDPSCM